MLTEDNMYSSKTYVNVNYLRTSDGLEAYNNARPFCHSLLYISMYHVVIQPYNTENIAKYRIKQYNCHYYTKHYENFLTMFFK